MNFTLTGGTDTQRRWFLDVVAALSFPTERVDVNVEVVWVAEPPCPGHNETGCAQVAGSDGVISLRDTLQEEGKLVYADTVAHELGHVYHFSQFTEAEREAQAAAWWRSDGGTRRTGTAADLNPLGEPWPDRIQEAWAEVWKDTFLKSSLRAYENRTNWKIDQADFAAQFTAPGDPSTAPEEWAPLFEPRTAWRIDQVGEASGFFAASARIPDDIPPGSTVYVSGTPEFSYYHAGASGVASSSYHYLVEGSGVLVAPSTEVIWTPFDGSTTYPLIDGWGSVCSDLEQQGFAPVGGAWADEGGWAWTPDPAKNQYVVFWYFVGPSIINDLDNTVWFTDVTVPPLVSAFHPVLRPDPPPATPPDFPYTPPVAKVSSPDTGVVRRGRRQ